jgi:hypothetical protein
MYCSFETLKAMNVDSHDPMDVHGMFSDEITCSNMSGNRTAPTLTIHTDRPPQPTPASLDYVPHSTHILFHSALHGKFARIQITESNFALRLSGASPQAVGCKDVTT